MESRGPRRPVAAWIVALTFGLALSGAGVLAMATRPAANVAAAPVEMDKGAFKTGCQSGGGSYVENADGSFQCNLKDGGVIKCQNTTSPCTYTSMLSPVDTLRIVNAGNLQVSQGANPTPAPTKLARSVLGGIVATIGPAKLPPGPTPLPSGNRSGIALTLWDCPTTVSYELSHPKLFPPSQVFASCRTLDNIVNKATFLVGGPGVQETTFHGGGILMNAVPAGKYLIRMTNTPSGYGNPVGYCGFLPSEDQPPPASMPRVPIGNGSYTFELGQDQTIYCNWYIIAKPVLAPANAAVATSVPVAATPGA